MSTDETSLEQVIDTMEHSGIEQRNIESTNFTKYPNLASELRHHILTYSDCSTLANYSICSKLCNLDIQIFNTEPPKCLEIKEENDGVVVAMCYVKNRYRYRSRRDCFEKRKHGEKKFMFINVENVLDELQKYLMKCYKHVGQKNTETLKINMKDCPTELMKMKHIKNIAKWEVTIYKTMYDDLMDYFKNNDHHISRLSFYDSYEDSNQATVCSDFFKSEMFKNLQTFYSTVKCEIHSEDFLNLSKEFVSLKSSISFDDIREKVRKWNNENHSLGTCIYIALPEDDNRSFNLSVLFPSDQFNSIPIRMSYSEKMEIGKVGVEVFRTGIEKDLRLTIIRKD